MLQKVLFMKFGAWYPLARQKQAIRKSFLRENRIFHQSVKLFSLEIFPLDSTEYVRQMTYMKNHNSTD